MNEPTLDSIKKSWPTMALPEFFTGNEVVDLQLCELTGMKFLLRAGVGETQISWEGDDQWYIGLLHSRRYSGMSGYGKSFLASVDDLIQQIKQKREKTVES